MGLFTRDQTSQWSVLLTQKMFHNRILLAVFRRCLQECAVLNSLSSSLYSRNKRVGTKSKSSFTFLFCFLSRLTKSESTDSLLSQASGSSGSHCAVAVTRRHSERSASLASVPLKQPGQPHRVTTKAGSASHIGATESETSKPAKESRSQKHTRVKVYVVWLWKSICLTSFHVTWFFNFFFISNCLHLYLLLNFVLHLCKWILKALRRVLQKQGVKEYVRSIISCPGN